jgi:DNA-binding response OmpR family regulator
MKILIVDDDPFSVNVAQRILSESGFQILTAGTVDEAIELLQFNDFDLVLSDILMPGKLGFELVEYIKSSDKPMPVIMMTAGFENAQDDYIMMAEMLADKAMSKPLHKADLLNAISNLRGN